MAGIAVIRGIVVSVLDALGIIANGVYVAATAGGWTDNGATVTTTTATDGVGIGGAPGAADKLKVAGDVTRKDVTITAGTGGTVTITTGSGDVVVDTTSGLLRWQFAGQDVLVMDSANGPIYIPANGAAFQTAKGTSALSAATAMNMQPVANFFEVDDTTTIDNLQSTGWQAGSVVYLKFNASVTVTNNGTPGAGFAKIMLAGGANFSATANDMLTLLFDGTVWNETARTVK